MQVNDTYHPTETLKHGNETYWSCCYCLEWFSGFGNNPDTEQEKVDYMTSLEPVYEEIFKSWYSDLEEVKGLERYTKVIDGVDGNKITLYIHKPKNLESSVPGILHIHGGVMSIMKARNANYKRWRDDLAAT